jgi:hypothetical protein
MTNRTRGWMVAAVFVVILLVNVIDGIDSVWNWLSVAVSAVMIPYGIWLGTGRRDIG